MGPLLPGVVAAGAVALVLVGLLIAVAKLYRHAEQGKALVITTMGGSEPIVSFTGRIVYPILHNAEVLDLSVKTVKLERRGRTGLVCKDDLRADLKVTFYLRVNRTQEDVLRVAQMLGCVRASDPMAVEELFHEKFSDALETIAKRMTFGELDQDRERFKDSVLDVIGRDLNGFVLDDMALDHVEKTPPEVLRKEDNTTPRGSNGISA